jgi:hypothetical protein
MMPPSSRVLGWCGYSRMPLAPIRPRNLWAFHIRLATQNIEFCSFEKLSVIRLSGRMSQGDGNRYA